MVEGAEVVGEAAGARIKGEPSWPAELGNETCGSIGGVVVRGAGRGRCAVEGAEANRKVGEQRGGCVKWVVRFVGGDGGCCVSPTDWDRSVLIRGSE